MKRKRAVAKRVRRDPFTRAHETAQARLGRAMIELERHEAKVEELRAEIPRLQKIIRAFAGDTQPLAQLNRTSSLEHRNHTVGVPAHLEKFMHPLETSVVDPANEGEDDFLPDARGQEILP